MLIGSSCHDLSPFSLFLVEEGEQAHNGSSQTQHHQNIYKDEGGRDEGGSSCSDRHSRTALKKSSYSSDSSFFFDFLTKLYDCQVIQDVSGGTETEPAKEAEEIVVPLLPSFNDEDHDYRGDG